MNIKKIKNRIYNDYFRPSRITEFENIIIRCKNYDYITLSIIDFYNLLKEDKIDKNRRYFIFRHDIDTDIKTARKFFEIEKKHNVISSYYFRLSTVDYKFMKEIIEYGSEVGYHYEELATFCKRAHIKDKKSALKNINKAKEKLKTNLKNIEQSLNVKIKSIASHGDFANRRLNLTNTILLNDNNFRNNIGIEVETYDDIIQKNPDLYISDAQIPIRIGNELFYDSFNKYKIICFLTHPRQWYSNPIENTKENIVHILEPKRAIGFLLLKNARVRWYLSVDYEAIPEEIKEKGQRTFRSITIEGKEIEFSSGFTDLHALSYRNILNGNGFGLEDARTNNEIVYNIRKSNPVGLKGDYHPFAKKEIEYHPFLKRI